MKEEATLNLKCLVTALSLQGKRNQNLLLSIKLGTNSDQNPKLILIFSLSFMSINTGGFFLDKIDENSAEFRHVLFAKSFVI